MINKLKLAVFTGLIASSFVVNAGNFTGPYAGFITGYGYSDASKDAGRRSNDGSQTVDASLNGLAGTQSYTRSGAFAGITGGYGIQIAPRTIVGVELDWAIANINGSDRQNGIDGNAHLGGCCAPEYLDYGMQTKADSELKDIGTLRGRIGFLPSEDFLAYFTAGMAWGGTDAQTTVNNYNANTGRFQEASDKNSGTSVGWTAGGGFEMAVTQQWNIKAEYLYYDLGNEDTNLTYTAGRWTDHDISVKDSYDFNGSLIRVGANFKF